MKGIFFKKHHSKVMCKTKILVVFNEKLSD